MTFQELKRLVNALDLDPNTPVMCGEKVIASMHVDLVPIELGMFGSVTHTVLKLETKK